MIIIYLAVSLSEKKGTRAVTGAVPFQKGTLLYQKGAYCTMKVPICTL